VASYVFPAGGQRGTTVKVRVGGLFLHERCGFALDGKGLTASPELVPTQRIWFEGPLLPIPESQQQEDYPADMLGTVAIAKDAALGPCRGRLFTAQGGAGGLVFVVGELPEVLEREADGEPIPEPVNLPVTANGRIFPREDIDLWEFDAEAGKMVTATVLSQSLNSPLAAKLDILDTTGKVLAENTTYPVSGSDASVRFTAPATGKYRVRITDTRSQGGPQYVYRLTITPGTASGSAFKAPPDGLPDATSASETANAPVALNGRIEKPGAVGEWKVELKKGGKYTLELQARRYGSALCGVVTVLDATGKELTRAEAPDANADPVPIAFTPTADGVYIVRVAERFRGRGGPDFAYRLRITEPAAVPPGFRLTVGDDDPRQTPHDTFTIPRGGSINLRIEVRRIGINGPIELQAHNLPKGVTAKATVIPANQVRGTLTLQVDATASVGVTPVTITGTAGVGPPLSAVVGVPVSVHDHRMTFTVVSPGTRFLSESSAIYLVVGLPTPFKIIDQFVMTSAPRGEVYRRKYRIERNGFVGPIEVRLADRQARHLQGVTGPVIVVPPGQDEFEYPITLPPWMEMGRTCRVCVMAVGKVKDPADGREHAVSFSSVGQNQQMIVVVGPGRLDLSLGKGSVRAGPGEVRVPVSVARGKDLGGAVAVEAMIPEHWKGVTAAPLTIPAGERTGEMVLTFAAESGPFNMPLTIRATARDRDTPVTAEAKLEVVK
jgi:hypothetical protein